MFILTFLEQIQFRLITDNDFMAAIQSSDACSVHFIAITEINTMKIASEKETDGVRRTVRHTAIQLMFTAMISYPPRQIGPETDRVRPQHGRSMYSIQRTFQFYIVPSGQII